MSLYTVSFDTSSSDTSDADQELNKYPENTQKPQDVVIHKVRHGKADDIASSETLPRAQRPLPKVRIVTEDEHLSITSTQVPPSPNKARTVKTFHLTRKKTLGWGKKLDFGFFKDGLQIYAAKASGFSHDRIYISKGDTISLNSNDFDGVIVSTNKNTSFTLFEQDQNGQPLLNVQIKEIFPSEPRQIRVYFSDYLKIEPKVLKNRPPKYNPSRGVWHLDFNGKSVLRSVKNCILETKDEKNAITICKIDNSRIEIETFLQCSEMIIFAIGIIICLATV